MRVAVVVVGVLLEPRQGKRTDVTVTLPFWCANGEQSE